MAESREDLPLDPEAEESIRQIADGLRRYLRLLLKKDTVRQPNKRKKGKEV